MTTLRILTLMVLLLWAAAAQAAGGQDIFIDQPGAGHGRAVDVAVAQDGTLFAASHASGDEVAVTIHRSTNGGNTWHVWSEMVSSYPDGKIEDARLMTTSASPGHLVVAWIDQDADGNESSVRVSRATADAEVPAWAEVTVQTFPSSNVTEPALDGLSNTFGSDRIVLVWVELTEVMFATSDDAGVSWSAPIALGSAADLIADVDVALDNQGVVHAAWASYEFLSETSTVHYRRATGHGEFPGQWDPEEVLGDVDDWIMRLSLAANPLALFDGVTIAAGSNYDDVPSLWVLESADGGGTWDLDSYPGFADPELVWEDTGRYLVARATDQTDVGDSLVLMQRDPDGWVADPMIDAESFVVLSGGHVALDPTRGGAPVMVGLMRSASDIVQIGGTLWFDATWRDAPGYGLPEAGTPYSLSINELLGGIVIGDVDGDQWQDLVFSQESMTAGRRVVRYDPVTGTAFTLRNGLHATTDIALVDIDADGDLEVACLREEGILDVVQWSGSFQPGYPRDLGLTDGAWISGAAVVGDETEDVVVAGGATVWVLGPGGVDRPGFPWTAPAAAGQAAGRVALGDVDFDGQMELVVPLTGGVAILGRDGMLEGIIGQGEAEPGNPSLADLDDDGDLEIAIPRADGTVHLVHHDGTPAGSGQWPYDTGSAGMPSQVALADIVGDQRRDLVFMDSARLVHIVPPSGNVPAGWPRAVDPATPVMEPVVAQLAPDETVVAIGGADGRLRLLTLSGPPEGWPRVYPEAVNTPVAAADLDGDGSVELALADSRNLWVLDMGVAWDDELEPWLMSGADPGRTGCVYDGEPAVVAAPTPRASGAVLHGAAPNPFNPMTTISFHVPAGASYASLRVHDAAGRLVRTLHQGRLAPGDHAVTWRGVDDRGRAVSSGVYFCRLEADGQTQGRSLVLVR